MNEATGYGPVCTEKAAIELENQINKSVEAGAKILVGGKRDGAFIEPTIMTDIPKGSPADCEELFGPVALIHIVKDEEDAIRVANDSDFGLGGSVHTNDLERGRRVAERKMPGAVTKPLDINVLPDMMFKQLSVGSSPVGPPVVIRQMLDFAARHKVAPVNEHFPMSKVNDAMEHLRSGKARYRIVLDRE
jgi:hypothetical protein